MQDKVVIALGGNAILEPGQKATYENQQKNILESTKIIAGIIKNGHRVIITHGNGPQVGNISRQNEVAKDIVPPLPLDVCSAESQGFIGYVMNQSLKNRLLQLGVDMNVVNVLTQTVVLKDDPAFQNPSKPIGAFYSEEEAKRLAEAKDWTVKEDAGRGWRRVVASPMPQTILEYDTIKLLTENNSIVIAAGGGGIPVIQKNDGTYEGVEAVIEKDRSALKLAVEVKSDIFMTLTDVPNVFINYGKSNQEALNKITPEQARKHVNEGQFSEGSMEPKIIAAIEFAERGGEAIICSLENAKQAIEGEAGTSVSLNH